MTPQEKAKQLFNKFSGADRKDSLSFIGNAVAKECALIAVNELIEELKGFNSDDGYSGSRIDFWNDVKSELSKL